MRFATWQKLGSESIPQIEPYLTDPEQEVRAEAVKASMKSVDRGSVDPLIKATRDNDPEVQIRATDGLVNFYLPGYLKTGFSGSLKRAGTSIRGKFTDTNDLVIDPYVQVQPGSDQALGKLARGGSSMESRAECRARDRHSSRPGRDARSAQRPCDRKTTR